MIFTAVCAAMFCARYSSGSMITRATPSDSTTFSALLEVQQISDSAFTADEVLKKIDDILGPIVERDPAKTVSPERRP